MYHLRTDFRSSSCTPYSSNEDTNCLMIQRSIDNEKGRAHLLLTYLPKNICILEWMLFW